MNWLAHQDVRVKKNNFFDVGRQNLWQEELDIEKLELVKELDAGYAAPFLKHAHLHHQEMNLTMHATVMVF